MVSADLRRMLDNLDECELDVISIVALKIATLRVEGYTGEISFSVNANQGSIGDVHINRKEIVKVRKKGRMVRSGGL